MELNSKVAGIEAKYDGLAKWIDAHPDKLKMSRSEFDALLAKSKAQAER